MKYREFKNLGWKVSALGFGAMRLPTEGDDSSNIKEKEAIEMLRWAIDHGVNYVDTAWPYHSGESENLVGKALKDGYREKVKVATKLPVRVVKNLDDAERILSKQLEKLEVDKIDFYLLHALNKERWETVQKLGIIDWAEEKRKEGKIDYLGFSFHDKYEVFKEIVDAYDWDFCQIQYNLLDTEFQAGKKGLKYAYSKDIPVVIMEPLKGGELANPPSSVKKVWGEKGAGRSPVDWCLKWLWNQPEVSVVLSGMSNLKQVKENVESASESGINSLSSEELEVLKEVKGKYQELKSVPCTHCQYCLPCPNGVNIPKIFGIYNSAGVSRTEEEAKEKYASLDESEKVKNCTECGQCEEKCPQGIEIMKRLKEAQRALK